MGPLKKNIHFGILSPHFLKAKLRFGVGSAAGEELDPGDREGAQNTKMKQREKSERPTEHRGIHGAAGAELDHDLQKEEETFHSTRLYKGSIRNSQAATSHVLSAQHEEPFPVLPCADDSHSWEYTVAVKK